MQPPSQHRPNQSHQPPPPIVWGWAIGRGAKAPEPKMQMKAPEPHPTPKRTAPDQPQRAGRAPAPEMQPRPQFAGMRQAPTGFQQASQKPEQEKPPGQMIMAEALMHEVFGPAAMAFKCLEVIEECAPRPMKRDNEASVGVKPKTEIDVRGSFDLNFSGSNSEPESQKPKSPSFGW